MDTYERYAEKRRSCVFFQGDLQRELQEHFSMGALFRLFGKKRRGLEFETELMDIKSWEERHFEQRTHLTFSPASGAFGIKVSGLRFQEMGYRPLFVVATLAQAYLPFLCIAFDRAAEGDRRTECLEYFPSLTPIFIHYRIRAFVRRTFDQETVFLDES